MQEFDDIRPYADHEVRPVLERLLRHKAFLLALARLKWPRLPDWAGKLLAPLVARVLRREVNGVYDVRGFQMVVEKYMARMIDSSTSGYTTSGLSGLAKDKAYLFLSNHRDIAMDPAFVGYSLHQAGFQTVRIAIGDNLLTRDYVSDLMRLNKSFIVKRSAKGPRQMLAAFQQLSGYIRHSLQVDGASIWIAQREGRAKNGWDATEPAIIKMLTMSRDKKHESFAELVAQLNIVPVAISYEFDPCDRSKAAELYTKETTGDYQKAEQEDVNSIAQSIAGNKGRIHIAFGTPLGGQFTTPEAVAAEVDRQVISTYQLYPISLAAYALLHPEADIVALPAAIEQLRQRTAGIPEGHRKHLLTMYANSVQRKLDQGLPVAAVASV